MNGILVHTAFDLPAPSSKTFSVLTFQALWSGRPALSLPRAGKLYMTFWGKVQPLRALLPCCLHSLLKLSWQGPMSHHKRTAVLKHNKEPAKASEGGERTLHGHAAQVLLPPVPAAEPPKPTTTDARAGSCYSPKSVLEHPPPFGYSRIRPSRR